MKPKIDNKARVERYENFVALLLEHSKDLTSAELKEYHELSAALLYRLTLEDPEILKRLAER